MAVCWLDGAIVPEEQAKVSVFDHGLLYGDGVFEGIRFYERQAFRLQLHLQRLQDSAQAINLTLPYSLTQLATGIHEVIRAYIKAGRFILSFTAITLFIYNEAWHIPSFLLMSLV